MARFFKINLQLFAEGGSGGDGAAAATAGGQAAQGVKADPTAASSGEKTVDPATAENRQEAYAKFKTDYKAEFDAEVQGIIKDRLKKSGTKNEELQKKLDSFMPIIDSLAIRYGADANDAAAILAAYEADDSNYEKEAYENNSSVEQSREHNYLKREIFSLTREKEAQQQREAEAEQERIKQETFARWDAEAKELKEYYPGFDFAKEVNNEKFAKLLNKGVDMRSAYEIAHRDEILRGAMQMTADKTAEKIANSVKANASRPSENGLSSQAAAVTKPDLNNLTRDQIAEYKRRMQNGERIDFVNNF